MEGAASRSPDKSRSSQSGFDPGQGPADNIRWVGLIILRLVILSDWTCNIRKGSFLTFRK